LRDRRRHQSKRERGSVGEHVARVREQRKGTGEDSDRDLGNEEADDERERGCQRAPARCRVTVVVPSHGSIVAAPLDTAGIG